MEVFGVIMRDSSLDITKLEKVFFDEIKAIKYKQRKSKENDNKNIFYIVRKSDTSVI